MNNFEKKIDFGEAGEQIFFDYINSLKDSNGVQNYVLMRVDKESNGWHYLDGILINKKTNEWSGIDVKMKPSRYTRPDTGVNKKSLDSYQRIKKARNLKTFYLICIDPMIEAIYWIELDNFLQNATGKETFKQEDDGRVTFNGDVIFCDLKHWNLLKEFNENEAKQLIEYAVEMNKIPMIDEYKKRTKEIKDRVKLLKR